VCDDSVKALNLMKRNSSLTHIIIINDINDQARKLANEKKINIISWKELIQIGKSNLKSPVVRIFLLFFIFTQ